MTIYALMALAAVSANAAAPSASPNEPDGSAADNSKEQAAEGDIIVSGVRYGQASVAADRELDDAQIATYGAESIDQLLKRAAPWIDALGDPPLLLINGKPIGYDQSILSYPAEALSRLEVLKGEANAQYGHGSSGRVVNLVLKRSFSSLSIDAGYDQPTRGGASGQRLSATRTAIQGQARWNASMRISRDTALMKSYRNGQRSSRPFYDQAAVGGLAGAELDPALSALVGRPVTVAALPTDSGPWQLDDFAIGFKTLGRGDAGEYESLQPERRSAALTLGITRPIGDFQLSLNLQANMTRNASQRGPANAQLLWRADHFTSSFAQDTQLFLPIAGHSSLRVEGESRSIGASINMNGRIAGWQIGVGVNLNRSWNENRSESGVDEAALQQQLDDGLWLPWDEVDPIWLRVSTSSGRQDMLAGQMNMSRVLWEWAGGPVNLSLSMNGNISTAYRTMDDEDFDPIRRRSGMGRATLSLPINQDGEGVAPFLGDISLDVGGSRQWSSGQTGQQSWTLGVNYRPWSWLHFRGSWDRSERAPNATQLDGPQEETIQRVFDYARQEFIDLLWVTGGNPQLRRGRQHNFMLSGTLRPTPILSWDVSYRQSVERGGISSLPELTPIIEAAFPDRIWRDDVGRLTRIDARPINLDEQMSSQLSHGLSFNWPPPSSPSAPAAAVGEENWRVQASLNHSVRLRSTLKIRDDVPIINQLSADSGQSRHSLSGQVAISRSGMGLTVQGQWSSAGRLRTAEDQPELRFKPPLILSLNSFLELNKVSGHPIFKNFRLSMDVQNLTRQYRRVTQADGSVPIGFGRDDADPVGRTIKLTIRKRF